MSSLSSPFEHFKTQAESESDYESEEENECNSLTVADLLASLEKLVAENPSIKSYKLSICYDMGFGRDLVRAIEIDKKKKEVIICE